ncbi:MAG: hypothetical protein P4L28_01265 [Paludibacteraceae bacterium]|nr:hypothetical protein [Paludibacteraceae bacterium]
MRKIILILALAVTSSLTFAQVENVKKAKSKASSDDSADVATAQTLITAALKDETTKNTVDAWYVNGLVYSKMFELQDNKRLEVPARKPDENIQSEVAYKAFKAWIVADSLDVVESKNNPKRKGKLKYREDIVEKIAPTKAYINNYGNILFNKQDFEGAKAVYEDFLSIPNLEMFKGSDKISPKDSLFIFTQNNLKLVFKRLCYKYLDAKDSVMYLKTLNEAIAVYPTDDYFLRNKIQYSINKGDEKGALENIDKTLALNPKNEVLYYVRGYIYAIKPDKQKEALADFQKAIDLKPDYAEAIAGYGDVLFGEGDIYYKKSVMASNSAADALKKSADDLYRQAITYYEKARSLKYNDDTMLRRLQSIYRKLQMFDKEKEIRTARGL